MNAASEGADAIREAAATATKPQTVYTMSDLIGRYLMERPDYPGRIFFIASVPCTQIRGTQYKAIGAGCNRAASGKYTSIYYGAICV